MACKDCASGTLHEGTPAGREETVHGRLTYITEPSNGAAAKGIVVIVTDAFGWKLVNSRILADKYAERCQFTVYVPDFMDGYFLDSSLLGTIHTVTDSQTPIYYKIFPGLHVITHMVPFLYYQRLSITKPRVFDFFTALRESTTLPIGAAGFCWGGKFPVLLCADIEKTSSGKNLIDAGYAAHPSQLAMPTDIEQVKLPLCISNGTLDIQLKPEGMETIKRILRKKRRSLGLGGLK